MRASAVLGLLAAVAVGGAAVVWWGQSVPSLPATGPTPTAAAPEMPILQSATALAATRAVESSPSVARQPVVSPTTEWTEQARALLARAEADATLGLVIAEVLDVGTIERAPLAESMPEHQDVRLRILAESGDPAVRLHAMLSVPLCPATSQQLYGCSTPFGELAAGQVRQFVLGRGRPDLGALSKLLAQRSRWLVLAGPEVARPDDPVLAAVPPALHGWLGRPLCNVFRARVCEAREGRKDERDGRTLAREFDSLSVDVLEVVQQAGSLPLRGRIRLAQEPFVGKLDIRSLTVGCQYWFATDEAALFQLLRAFAPPR